MATQGQDYFPKGLGLLVHRALFVMTNQMLNHKFHDLHPIELMP